MPEVTAIAQNLNCDIPGGIEKAYATDKANITAVTVASGVVTAVTMSGSGQWGLLYADDQDEVAFMNETGQEQNNRVRVETSGLLQFNGITQSKITAANNAKACCGVVVVAIYKDGTRRVHGLDVDTSDNWTFSQKFRIVPNINSGTGAESTVVQYNFVGIGDYHAPTTTLTDTAIEAL